MRLRSGVHGGLRLCGSGHLGVGWIASGCSWRGGVCHFWLGPADALRIHTFDKRWRIKSVAFHMVWCAGHFG